MGLYVGFPAQLWGRIRREHCLDGGLVVARFNKRSDSHNVSALLAELDGPDPATQSAAWRALVALGAEPVERLISLLTSSNDQTRMHAASALCAIGDHRAVAPLLALVEDPSPRVRHVLAVNLHSLTKDRQVVPILKRLALDSALETYPSSRISAARSLQSMGEMEESVEVLCELLAFPGEQVRSDAAAMLGETGQRRAVEPLIQALQREGGRAAIPIMLALGKLGDQRALTPLVAALSSPRPQHRAIAAQALGSLGHPDAVKPLRALLQDRAVAWEEDHGGPSTTVADAASRSLQRLQSLPGQ